MTFGELLLRLSPPGDERLFASPELVTFFGGSEANVAVGLRHLGIDCDYVTCLPSNPIGDAALAPEQRRTRTNIVFKANESLLSSGLLGPVVVMRESPQR